MSLARGEWMDPARARVTVGDWAEQWLVAKSATLKATTRESYRSLLAVCIMPTWARVTLAAVTHADVAAWVARLSTEVGASRCRKSATLLSGMMAAAVRDQRIVRNPCDGVVLPRLPAQRQRFLSLLELQQLARAAGEYELMVLVLGLCGLRFGECVALRVGSVDPLRRRLRVVASLSEVSGRLVWSTPKTHQSRDVPLPRSVLDQLVDACAGRAADELLLSCCSIAMVSLCGCPTGDAGCGGRRSRRPVRKVSRRTTCATPRRRWRSRPARR